MKCRRSAIAAFLILLAATAFGAPAEIKLQIDPFLPWGEKGQDELAAVHEFVEGQLATQLRGLDLTVVDDVGPDTRVLRGALLKPLLGTIRFRWKLADTVDEPLSGCGQSCNDEPMREEFDGADLISMSQRVASAVQKVVAPMVEKEVVFISCFIPVDEEGLNVDHAVMSALLFTEMSELWSDHPRYQVHGLRPSIAQAECIKGKKITRDEEVAYLVEGLLGKYGPDGLVAKQQIFTGQRFVKELIYNQPDYVEDEFLNTLAQKLSESFSDL